MALLKPTEKPSPAPGDRAGSVGAGPVLLAPRSVISTPGTPRRPYWPRAAGLMLGLAMGEAMALGRHRSTRMNDDAPPLPPGPGAVEAEIVGKVALRGPVTTRRIAEAFAESIVDPEHPGFEFVQDYRVGRDWRGARSSSADALPVMRALPLALVLFSDDTAMMTESAASVLATHTDIRAVAAAVIAPWAGLEVLGLSRKNPVSPVDMLERLALRCRSMERVLVRRCSDLLDPSWRQHHHDVSNAIYRAAGLCGSSAREAMEFLIKSRSGGVPEPVGAAMQQADLALPLAMLLAFHQRASFAELMEPAMECSQGSRAFCGILGALAGGRLGLKALPGPGSTPVSGRERMISLARALAGDPQIKQGSIGKGAI